MATLNLTAKTGTGSDLHIITTRDGLVLVRRVAALTGHDFENQYPGFIKAYGPLDRNGVLDTFENEWPDLLVTNHDAIRTFISDAAGQPAAELRL